MYSFLKRFIFKVYFTAGPPTFKDEFQNTMYTLLNKHAKLLTSMKHSGFLEKPLI